MFGEIEQLPDGIDFKSQLPSVADESQAAHRSLAIETPAGQAAGSKALQADALDFLGDTLTYGISLAVIGQSIQVRSGAAFSGARACC